MRTAALVVVLATCCPWLPGPAAHAQYPVKPVRVIVPFAAGSVNDLIARVLAPPLAEALGQPFLVDNRPGVAGNLGAEQAAKSAPDGYTLLLGNISQAIGMTLYEKPGYDLNRDFAPITHLAAGSFMLVVHPSLPAKDVKSLVALAKARPGELNIGVGGAGIIVAAELFKSMAGARMANVSYKGTPQILTAVASGEVSAGFPPTSAAVPLMKAGKVRGLGVTSRNRSPMAPEVPSIAEAGLRDYEATTWYCLLAPAGVPREIVARLNAETARAIDRPDVKGRFAATDLTPRPSTPEELAAFLRAETLKWGKVVKAAGMRSD